MRIAVIGQGAREHATAVALMESPSRPDILSYPGHDGLNEIARKIDLAPKADLAQQMKDEGVGLCVIGEEKYLDAGLADRCIEIGVPVWGPIRSSARLETSKIFAKEFMTRHGVPTAQFAVAMTAEAVRRAAGSGACVLKYDGLASGKGVAVCDSQSDTEAFILRAFDEKQFGPHPAVVVEERLEGREISVIAAVSDGKCRLFAPARDYKRLLDGDRGPNTGGMGAVASPFLISRGEQDEIESRIVRPVMRGLACDGMAYRGFLYFGLMMTADGPRALEFNCRFGDPEAQSVFAVMRGDYAEYLASAAAGKLPDDALTVESKWAVTVVLASRDYPLRPGDGETIDGIDRIYAARIFHSGTKKSPAGTWTVSGGRVLSVTATAGDRESAVERAYAETGKIRFDGMQFRRDIGRLHFDEADEAVAAGASGLEAGT